MGSEEIGGHFAAAAPIALQISPGCALTCGRYGCSVGGSVAFTANGECTV